MFQLQTSKIRRTKTFEVFERSELKLFNHFTLKWFFVLHTWNSMIKHLEIIAVRLLHRTFFIRVFSYLTRQHKLWAPALVNQRWLCWFETDKNWKHWFKEAVKKPKPKWLQCTRGRAYTPNPQQVQRSVASQVKISCFSCWFLGTLIDKWNNFRRFNRKRLQLC